MRIFERFFVIMLIVVLTTPSYVGAVTQNSSPSRAIGDSVRSFDTYTVGYVLSETDKNIIKNATSRIEEKLKLRGELYRNKLVLQLKNAANKYSANPRMAAIISTTADQVWSAAVDATKSKTYTQAELLLVKGSNSLSYLGIDDITAIVADQTTSKLLAPIQAKLQAEFSEICDIVENGSDKTTMTCANVDGKNYVKYLYLSTEITAKYSSNAEDRAYASGSIIWIQNTLYDWQKEFGFNGDEMYPGFYTSDDTFHKMRIGVNWVRSEFGIAVHIKVTFSISPYVPGSPQQVILGTPSPYTKLSCISLFGCPGDDEARKNFYEYQEMIRKALNGQR